LPGRACRFGSSCGFQLHLVKEALLGADGPSPACENPATGCRTGQSSPAAAATDRAMQILNTLTVLALVVMSFALIVAVPVLYASSDDSGRSNRLILLGGLVWVALVLVNWGMSFFVV